MAVRTTIDILEPLHELLRRRAEQTGSPIRSLIVRAVQNDAYVDPVKARLSGLLSLRAQVR